MRIRLVILTAIISCLLAQVKTEAQSLHLSIGSSTITFPSSNPATVPTVSANENPVILSVSYSGISIWTVTMIAGGALVSGANTIPIGNVHFTGTGMASLSGVLSTLTPILLANASVGQASGSENLNFTFTNSWTYSIGVYTSSVIITAISI